MKKRKQSKTPFLDLTKDYTEKQFKHVASLVDVHMLGRVPARKTRRKSCPHDVEINGNVRWELSDDCTYPLASFIEGDFYPWELKEAKRLHAWLGKAIQYLEQEKMK